MIKGWLGKLIKRIRRISIFRSTSEPEITSPASDAAEDTNLQPTPYTPPTLLVELRRTPGLTLTTAYPYAFTTTNTFTATPVSLPTGLPPHMAGKKLTNLNYHQDSTAKRIEN